MNELIKKLAENEELQAKIKKCKDAGEFASLLKMDKAQAEKVFPKVKEMLESDTVSEDMLKDVAGGCTCNFDCVNPTDMSPL